MIWRLVKFDRLNKLLLPTFFRKVRILSFLNAIAKAFQALADKILYEMQHDSRVIYLEKMLNEYFEVSEYNPMSHIATRQIYIVDAPQLAKAYVYQPAENSPLYLGTAYLDRNTIGYQFIVKIPVAITFDELKVRAKIDFYKLAGKQYIIETY